MALPSTATASATTTSLGHPAAGVGASRLRPAFGPDRADRSPKSPTTDSFTRTSVLSQSADQDDPSAYGNFRPIPKGLRATSGSAATTSPITISLQGHVGVRHHDARDRPHHGAEARAQDYTNSDLSGYFGTYAALRQPVASPRIVTAGLVADDLYARALHQQPFAATRSTSRSRTCKYDLAALQYL
jgi:hypothetical protein